MMIRNGDRRRVRGGSYLLPLLSALLLWLAAPGDFGFWPLSFFALVPLFFFLEQSAFCFLPAKKVFFAGLAFGVVLFVFLLHWIVNVISHYGGLPLPVSVLALLLLSVYMALYPAFFCLAVRQVTSRFPAVVLLLFLPACWVGLDWLRGWAFTGFPWMDFGCYLASEPFLIQPAALLGHHGVTAMLVFINTGVWLLLSRYIKCGRFVSLFLVAGIMLYALASLLPSGDPSGEVQVGIVQGNVSQEDKWSPEAQKKTVLNYLTLSRSLLHGSERPDLFVWPETAMPFYPSASDLTEDLINFVHTSETPLLTGVPWFKVIDRQKKIFNFYNAALLLAPQEQLDTLYFKSHLVPFGEYVPLQKALPFLAPLVESGGNFTPGTIHTPLEIPFTPAGDISSAQQSIHAGVLICYESVFPELSREWVNAGANLLVNITNDAWYGRSSAPKHSFAMTIMRAVETRRTIVRAANTGYSGLILPDGRVQQRSDLFVPAAETVTAPLMSGSTPYVRFGWFFGPLCFLLSIALFAGSAVCKRVV